MSPEQVKKLLGNQQEVAFIDVRETADYGRGHPFFVSHVAYSILEAKITSFVPCLKTTVILIDNGDGISEKASLHLGEMGYQNIITVKGGINAWRDAGYALYEGISAPSKSFGEVVEHELGTPSITATELKARMDAGDDFLLLDGRTPAEFNKMTIPGSTSCPNAELALRYRAMMENPNADIIVNCAGRTRSLIGAQSLRLLEINNNVYALENGTMGWKIAGLELEHGAIRSFPSDLNEGALVEAVKNAETLSQKYSIETIDQNTLKAWQSDKDRTTYTFDVRTEEEFTEGHVSGATHAPGGQLVQATDQWFATRNARIVVYDNHKIRAVITAIWLKGMGHDAYVLDNDELITEKSKNARYSNCETIPIGRLAAKLEDGVTLLDVRSSQAYRDAHIEGALWTIRPKLSELNIKGDVVIIADDISIADLAAKDIDADVSISISSFGGWDIMGFKVVSTPNNPPDEDRIDFQFHTHARHSGNLDHAREYLRWETGLMDQMDDQEKATLKPL
ncbi:MAG: sulfurtransferase [Kordiimonadaceae bacterium]|nr:sulfurtransferase [Kordiimonadaceae bacterium]